MIAARPSESSACVLIPGAPSSFIPAMPRQAADFDRILKGVSRTFYLTLRIAPRVLRRQLGLAYLFCRAADTIADTALLPAARRRELLKLYRAQFEGEAPSPDAARDLARELTSARSLPEERLLLASLEGCFDGHRSFAPGDRALIRRLVTTLTLGMEMDLASFPLAREEPGPDLVPEALPDDAALERYCYHVAGCVGEFWTDLAAAHVPALSGWDLPSMRAKGVRFGKGLQMTNVLRDLPRDLRLGRCYLPQARLLAAGIAAESLRGGGKPGAALPEALGAVVDDLLDLTLDHYRSGWEYTLSIPRRAPRLRLACAWPLLIGLETLALLRTRRADLLSGATLKVTRGRVRRILAGASLRALSNQALDALYRRLVSRAVRGACASS